MEWQDLGASGAVGFVTAIITLLGWDRRMKKVEDRMVTSDFCDERHKTVETIQKDLEYIKGRIDRIFDYTLNGKK
jgi:hypothetical protein